jgi:hypothetical protein
MPFLTTLITVVILVCADPLSLCQSSAAVVDAASPFDVLVTKRQEQLYYTVPTLPADVQALIQGPIVVSDAIAYYKRTNDEVIKFNLVLILDKKVRAHQLSDKDTALACDFFAICLGHANPWIVTEAVFALGNAQGKEALPAIQSCFTSPYATVVFHAVVASKMITGAMPNLSQVEMDQVKTVYALTRTGNHDALNELASKELQAYETTPAGAM